ncbi:MAG: TRAP transporter small permease subunit [Alphaproteobacteria bacterium]|nr:TRAP transporter small permease subunit [Alphaproteobacteria bacterium]
MGFLLTISKLIDALNERVGRIVYWGILAAALISSFNAVMRYAVNYSSNAWLEVQWYLFAMVFLLSAGYTLLRNEHIRIDVVTGRFSRRTQAWIDVLGTLFFLLPMAVTIMILSWPMVTSSFVGQEMSGDAGGLVRWPVKAMIPAGFLLLSLQGLSELIKRVAFLAGRIEDPLGKQGGPHSHASAEG